MTDVDALLEHLHQRVQEVSRLEKQSVDDHQAMMILSRRCKELVTTLDDVTALCRIAKTHRSKQVRELADLLLGVIEG